MQQYTQDNKWLNKAQVRVISNYGNNLENGTRETAMGYKGKTKKKGITDKKSRLKKLKRDT